MEGRVKVAAGPHGLLLFHCFLGLEEAEVLLVAVQSQHVTRVVAFHEMLVVLVGDRGCVLGKLEQVLQPLSVFIQTQEGEVQAAAPGGRTEHVECTARHPEPRGTQRSFQISNTGRDAVCWTEPQFGKNGGLLWDGRGSAPAVRVRSGPRAGCHRMTLSAWLQENTRELEDRVP